MSNPGSFLQSYVRVRNEAVCRLPLSARQVVVWTVKNGQWVWRHPAPSGSWCKNALKLLVPPGDYARVKKELFDTQRAFNGVYKHQTKNLFAIVYEPSEKTAVAFSPTANPTKWQAMSCSRKRIGE